MHHSYTIYNILLYGRGLGVRWRLGGLQGGRGGGGVWGELGGEGGEVQIRYAVYTMQLGSSRHLRALRVRSTIQLT